MELLLLLIFAVLALLLALFFSVTNGFNDASATVATMIACGAASPERAVCCTAAIWGFAGAMLGGTAVALTMISLVVVPLGQALVYLNLAALAAAVAWNLIATLRGIPSSSTHALVGGLIVGGHSSGGLDRVNWGIGELLSTGDMTGVTKVVVFLLLSVVIGFVGGFVAQKLMRVALRNANWSVNHPLMTSQYISRDCLPSVTVRTTRRRRWA